MSDDRAVRSFSLHCFDAQGGGDIFEMLDAVDVAAAEFHARRLLSDHKSVECVIVFEADHEVARVERGELPAAASLISLLGAMNERYPRVAIIATCGAGVVRHWNSEAARLYGWRMNEAIGRDILELTPARQSTAEAASIMKQLGQGKIWQGEIILKRRDGTPFRAFVADIPVVAGDDLFIVGASVPIAERDRLERTREGLEDDLKSLFAPKRG